MSSNIQNAPLEKITIKLVVLGTSNVGKTALITRFCNEKFTGVRQATVGADFASKRLQIMDYDVMLQIWDTAGQERFHQNTLGAAFYRGADGCLLVFDVTNDKSIDQLCQWRDELLGRVADDDYYFPIVVVGNKVDLLEPQDQEQSLSPPPNTHTPPPEEGGKNNEEENENKEANKASNSDLSESDNITHSGSSGSDSDDKVDTWKSSPPASQALNRSSEQSCRSTSTVSQSALNGVSAPREVVKKWCKENGYGHVETSAKDGDGVSAAVMAITALALEQLRESGRLEKRIQAAKQKSRSQSHSQSGRQASKIDMIGQKYSDKSNNNCC